LLFLATLATAVVLVSIPEVSAQQGDQGQEASGESSGRPVQRSYGVGGTSLTLRDIWGPAKMPPAPTDFGPHFDYPPETLNGAPLHDPYPN
jgi:hypothetical protein